MGGSLLISNDMRCALPSYHWYTPVASRPLHRYATIEAGGFRKGDSSTAEFVRCVVPQARLSDRANPKLNNPTQIFKSSIDTMSSSHHLSLGAMIALISRRSPQMRKADASTAMNSWRGVLNAHASIGATPSRS